MTKMIRCGGLDNEIIYTHLCDKLADRNNIDPKYISLGTKAIILKGEDGIEVYLATSDKQWNKVSNELA